MNTSHCMIIREHRYHIDGINCLPIKTTRPSKYFRFWDQKLDIQLESFPRDLEYAIFEIREGMLLLKEAIFPEVDEIVLKKFGYKYLENKGLFKNQTMFVDLNIRIHYNGEILFVNPHDKQFIYRGRVKENLGGEIAVQSLIELTFDGGKLIKEERFSAAVATSHNIYSRGTVF